jgi:hypothetical protein
MEMTAEKMFMRELWDSRGVTYQDVFEYIFPSVPRFNYLDSLRIDVNKIFTII